MHQLRRPPISPNRYDLVVRIRPDLVLQEASNLDFERIYLECERRRVIFADFGPRLERYGCFIGDQFAVGSPDCMTAYAEAYNLTLQAAAGGLPNFPTGFLAHQNLACATFRSGIRVEEFKSVGFGPLLDPITLTSAQVRELVLKDIGARPRNIADELFIRACAEVP